MGDGLGVISLPKEQNTFIMEMQEVEVKQGACDESKCVSTGLSNLYNGSFTCYGDADGSLFPQMCADGFLPLAIDDEDETIVDGSAEGDTVFQYFTCCPPMHESFSNDTATSTAAIRHCSDPIARPTDWEGQVNNSLCENQGSRRHARPMKKHAQLNPSSLFSGIVITETDSFLCCDSSIGDDDGEEFDTDHHLDELECVPYRNQFYESIHVENRIGTIRAISCDFPDDEFSVPYPLGEELGDPEAFAGRFQCCRNDATEFDGLSPFVQDSAFETTVYLPIVLYSLTAMVCAIVIVALVIPLLVQIKTKCWPNITKRGTKWCTPPYSTYNLYLVYSALSDLAWSLQMLVTYGNYLDQNFHLDFHSPIVSPSDIPFVSPRSHRMARPYIFQNVWINTILAYEILVLLTQPRIASPSLLRVNLQMGVVYCLSLAYHLGLLRLSKTSRTEGLEGNFERVKTLDEVAFGLTILLGFTPMIYIYNVGMMIWCRGHIPSSVGASSSPEDKATRDLALFLVRFVAIFCWVWVPAYLIGELHEPWALWLSQCLMCLAPLASTILMIRTKKDARNYIADLFTLSCLFPKQRVDEETKVQVTTTPSGDLDTPKTARAGSGVVASPVAAAATAELDITDDELAAFEYDVGYPYGETESAPPAKTGTYSKPATYAKTGTYDIYPSRQHQNRNRQQIIVLGTGEILSSSEISWV